MVPQELKLKAAATEMPYDAAHVIEALYQKIKE